MVAHQQALASVVEVITEWAGTLAQDVAQLKEGHAALRAELQEMRDDFAVVRAEQNEVQEVHRKMKAELDSWTVKGDQTVLRFLSHQLEVALALKYHPDRLTPQQAACVSLPALVRACREPTKAAVKQLYQERFPQLKSGIEALQTHVPHLAHPHHVRVSREDILQDGGVVTAALLRHLAARKFRGATSPLLRGVLQVVDCLEHLKGAAPGPLFITTCATKEKEAEDVAKAAATQQEVPPQNNGAASAATASAPVHAS